MVVLVEMVTQENYEFVVDKWGRGMCTTAPGMGAPLCFANRHFALFLDCMRIVTRSR
jgi:hypothetical protein